MDNDLCIIYEKGIKPVKAKKYYYFREPIARKLQSYTMNHNDFDAGERGEWRKFNPYNRDSGLGSGFTSGAGCDVSGISSKFTFNLLTIKNKCSKIH